jgi:hypothetical protein
MALISQADLEARLQRTLTAEEASAFTSVNSALQAYVEKIIGSDVESVSLSTRYYDGGCQHLKIDPCTDISSVKQVDDDDAVIYTYVTSDYVPEPKNGTVKTMLRHRNSNGYMNGINNIAVNAKFSINADAKTLSIVKDALLDALVSEIQNSGNILKESIEGYSVEYASNDAKVSLNRITYLFPEV